MTYTIFPHNLLENEKYVEKNTVCQVFWLFIVNLLFHCFNFELLFNIAKRGWITFLQLTIFLYRFSIKILFMYILFFWKKKLKKSPLTPLHCKDPLIIFSRILVTFLQKKKRKERVIRRNKSSFYQKILIVFSFKLFLCVSP